MRHRLMVNGAIALVPQETRIPLPRRQATGDVQQLPVTGRPYATGTPGQYTPAQVTVTTTVRGVSAQDAREQLAIMERRFRLATRLYDGARFLPVLRLSVFDPPEEGFAGQSWKLSMTYDLLSPLYHLGPDDQRPRPTPLEQDDGLYVLGAAEIIGGGDDFVDLVPLDGYSFVPGTYTAPFSGITYQILEVDYDDIS
ncbi:hypothetical protein GO986_18060 [Deinococcus sp. HMF7620]|uniref:Uncharacterized protein n=1 Tax=Deinococcus arboris TaxID=2682977 RepID=A0A7C9MT52_9DEIO|nr:hypothetical protein [Deinococcus arboris]MVN88644.1 hypothetical protein [Deinococcus arboris]